MNKAELIDAIRENTNEQKATISRVLDGTIEAIQNALVEGENVVLIGFGTFEVRKRSARQGRNPRTGEPIQIAASTSAGFKPGKALKDALNDK